jgi:predicted O-methyltransferase YrrM
MKHLAYAFTDGHDPMTHAEIDALYGLAAALGPNPIIVNIGAADGLSTVTFLEGCADAFVFSLDTEECPQERANVEAAGLDPTRVARVLGRSQETGRQFPYEADLVFVDGGHDYESVVGDIDTWAYRVKVGGILAFHDYIEPPPPPENPSYAYDAVNENLSSDFKFDKRVDRLIVFHRRREGEW